MSDFVEVKISDLAGTALDWAVAEVLISLGEMTRDQNAIGTPYINGKYVFGPGVETNRNNPDGSPYITHGCGSKFNPSSDWYHGGPLWDKWVTSMGYYDGFLVSVVGGDATGPTKLIALCRAIVSTKLGDVVQVPAELVDDSVNNDNT